MLSNNQTLPPMNMLLMAGALLIASWIPIGTYAIAGEPPLPESPLWLTYPGGPGPGQGKHIMLIAADQEYRSEHSLPMLARLLSKHHGFD